MIARRSTRPANSEKEPSPIALRSSGRTARLARRRGDAALKREIEVALDREHAAIERILDRYGVPRVPPADAVASKREKDGSASACRQPGRPAAGARRAMGDTVIVSTCRKKSPRRPMRSGR